MPFKYDIAFCIQYSTLRIQNYLRLAILISADKADRFAHSVFERIGSW